MHQDLHQTRSEPHYLHSTLTIKENIFLNFDTIHCKKIYKCIHFLYHKTMMLKLKLSMKKINI